MRSLGLQAVIASLALFAVATGPWRERGPAAPLVAWLLLAAGAALVVRSVALEQVLALELSDGRAMRSNDVVPTSLLLARRLLESLGVWFALRLLHVDIGLAPLLALDALATVALTFGVGTLCGRRRNASARDAIVGGEAIR